MAHFAARLRLHHRMDEYNAVQRLPGVGALMFCALAIASGLALWKPVQLSGLNKKRSVVASEVARRVHFVVMVGINGSHHGRHLMLVILLRAHCRAGGDWRARLTVRAVEKYPDDAQGIDPTRPASVGSATRGTPGTYCAGVCRSVRADHADGL